MGWEGVLPAVGNHPRDSCCFGGRVSFAGSFSYLVYCFLFGALSFLYSVNHTAQVMARVVPGEAGHPE